jgi:hypothetical protein
MSPLASALSLRGNAAPVPAAIAGHFSIARSDF